MSRRSRRFDVQVCVSARTTRQYGTHPTSDLLGVDFIYTVLAENEFPRTAQFDLFARFFVAELKETTIRISVWRLTETGQSRDHCYRRDFVVPFRPEMRVVDRSFRLVNVNLPGEGQYAVRLARVSRHRWKGLRWRVMTTDYFRVVRAS